MSVYEIMAASLSDVTRYSTGEPSLSATVSIGIGLNGDRTLNVTIPVDLQYDENGTMKQLEERAFAEAVQILRDIGTPDPAELVELYRKQFIAE